MRIVVVGNSVAGRSVVSLLARSPLASSITSLHVLDNHPYTASESLSSQFYTSLWSPSIDILLNKLNIPVDTWNRLSCAVEESGYRSQAGQWLAQPSRGLQPPPGKSTLLHIIERNLCFSYC